MYGGWEMRDVSGIDPAEVFPNQSYNSNTPKIKCDLKAKKQADLAQVHLDNI